MLTIFAATTPTESVPDWLAVAGILALAAILGSKWVRHEIRNENNTTGK